MFDSLAERLGKAVDSLRGRGRLTEENVAETLRQVRMALLEADVAVPVVKSFTDAARARAIGAEVTKSLTPGQAFIGVIHEELTRVMGEPGRGLNLQAAPPVVVLLAGLQGAGKTTTAAKLARHLIEKHRRKPLAREHGRVSPRGHDPARAARRAGWRGLLHAAGRARCRSRSRLRRSITRAATSTTSLIVDTAGRLHVDEAMMEEVRAIDAAVGATERLFVVDSMAGQDAVRAAQSFNAALDLTGVILTKADGDARGGAALSVRQVTGKPILFVGVGEKTEALESFHPERIASRILGMGDVLVADRAGA